MDRSEYFLCRKHHQVEGDDGCRAEDRLGPYSTIGEAEAALERVKERNDQWDNDPTWDDDVPKGEPSP